MRGEIRELQQSLGITAIYVTHDQEEALAISDRIAVMRAGVLEQVDKPDVVYRDSATPFVAEFMGITNLYSGKVARREGTQVVLEVGATQFRMEAGASNPGETITFCLRPEALRVIAAGDTAPDGCAFLEAQVARVEFLGALTRLEARIAGGLMLRVAVLDQPLEMLTVGRMLTLAYDPRRVTLLKSS
jgi:ABC-type Fe3+/spermidine/putrescine transport system ATPase subunit